MTTADADATAFARVKRFLVGWKPFAELSDSVLAAQVLALLGEPDPDIRRRHLAAGSDLYRLHDHYRALDLLREGKNEKSEQFERLLATPIAEFARAIEQGRQKDYLGLLQFCFEFGRHAMAPRHNLMREFLCKLLELEPGAVGMKYSLYSGGVLYASAGKSHDEMAQDFARLGMVGAPIAGGAIARVGQLEYLYDMASTAYKATTDPEAVRDPLLRWVRNTGGAEDRLSLRYDTTRQSA